MHLNGQPVEIVDVENVLGGVADQKSDANEKKYSAKAVNEYRNQHLLAETVSFFLKETF